MIFYLLALLIGIVAGLRAMAPPALVTWAAHLGWLDLSGSWLGFLANAWVRWILTLLAIVELVTARCARRIESAPTAPPPSSKTPLPSAARC